MRPDDTRTRVVVGAKGSGKTIFLRRLQAYLMNNEAIYVQENQYPYVKGIEQELPTTDLIVKFSQCYPEANITEKWMYAWKMAILRSIVSNLLTNVEWNFRITEKEKKILRDYTGIIYPEYNVPMTIYDELRNILSSYNSRKEFDSYFDKREWDELVFIIGIYLRKLQPIYFFIDSVDDEYEHAPMYWLRCQKGLFYRIMRFVRDANFGNKLHIIISIRDSVMAAVCESEHQTRYINEDHVHIIHWNYTSIKCFFNYKIIQLNRDAYKSNLKNNIEKWLGIGEIYNIHRDIYEPIDQYIIRHTRLIPRDVVVIGNRLVQICEEYNNDRSLDLENMIRHCVSDCARTFGRELLYSQAEIFA